MSSCEQFPKPRLEVVSQSKNPYSKVIFVTAVTADGSVTFFANDANFSISHFFVFLSPKLLKFGTIKGVKLMA